LEFSDEERRDAAKTEVLICRKLHEIMDLQADIDALIREKHPTPFGSARWKNSRPETLQRLVALTAIQFLLFEPVGWVQSNGEVHDVGRTLIELLLKQIKLLEKRETKGWPDEQGGK
jgi:hypothetical protein